MPYPASCGRVTFVVLVFGSLLVCSCRTGMPTTVSTGPAPPPQAAGYRLTFTDDFDLSDLSPTGIGQFNWYKGLWWEAPAPDTNFGIAGGLATLSWTRGQLPEDTTLTTVSRDGQFHHTWRYGYFEVRMKWNALNGAWPAIWMLPLQGVRGASSDTGELDIFEGQGATPHIFYGTIHEWEQRRDIRNNKGVNAARLPATVDLTQFHTYGALWTPGQVTWYFDNHALFSASTYPVFDQQDYYLILASQEGMNWKYGDLSGVTAPRINTIVDWVRVWQK